jgi:hypothetical protein
VRLPSESNLRQRARLLSKRPGPLRFWGGAGGFTGILCVSGTRRPQNLLRQHAGAAEQRNPPQDQRCWEFPQPRFLSPIGDNLPHGVCRGLVCFQSIFESKIHSDTAAKRSLIHCSESRNCELSLTRPDYSLCFRNHTTDDFLRKHRGKRSNTSVSLYVKSI